MADIDPVVMDDIRTRLEIHAAILKRLDEPDRAALGNYKLAVKQRPNPKHTTAGAI